MPSTAPIYVEPDAGLKAEVKLLPSEPDGEEPDRVHKLEGEVAELRETIARFAELMIGEVKGLRNSQAETPAIPPGIAGDLPAGPAVRRPWLLMELLADLSTTVRMYLDPRYRVLRATQILVPLLILLFAFNCLFFNLYRIEIISPALEKLVDVVLAILLYKVISRELARYRQIIAQLLAWQHYQAKATARVVSSEPAMTRLETE